VNKVDGTCARDMVECVLSMCKVLGLTKILLYGSLHTTSASEEGNV
jgi:hypothetical protein